MKKLIGILAIIILATSLSFGQSYKLKASSFSSKIEGKSWAPATVSGVIVTINLDIKTIVIYSKAKQQYDIINNSEAFKDKDGDDVMPITAVDSNGIECDITLLKIKSQGGRLQLYVRYSNVSWLYNLETVE